MDHQVTTSLKIDACRRALQEQQVWAHLDDCHTASQLGNALTQLLSVIHGVGLAELLPDLGNARADLLLVGSICDQGGVVVDGPDLQGATWRQQDCKVM